MVAFARSFLSAARIRGARAIVRYIVEQVVESAVSRGNEVGLWWFSKITLFLHFFRRVATLEVFE